jgi:hypothetical protein
VVQAQSSLPRRTTIGFDAGWLHAVAVKGGIGPDIAHAQSPTLGAELYASWQASDLFAVGLGIPTTLNAPGVSSNAYDVGLAPRLRAGYLVRDWLYPYFVAEAGPARSHQPQGWLNGVNAAGHLGARTSVAEALAIFLELSYEYTSFSGDLPLYSAASGPPAPVLRGNVRTSYLGIAAGLELGL